MPPALETAVFAVSERTALAETLFGTENGATSATGVGCRSQKPQQIGRSRLLTPVSCSDATHPPNRFARTGNIGNLLPFEDETAVLLAE